MGEEWKVASDRVGYLGHGLDSDQDSRFERFQDTAALAPRKELD